MYFSFRCYYYVYLLLKDDKKGGGDYNTVFGAACGFRN